MDSQAGDAMELTSLGREFPRVGTSQILDAPRFSDATGQPRPAKQSAAPVESGLGRFPPVTGPDRSRSLLLRAGVYSSTSAGGTLTRQKPLVRRPLRLQRSAALVKTHLAICFPCSPRGHKTTSLGLVGPLLFPDSRDWGGGGASEEEAAKNRSW